MNISISEIILILLIALIVIKPEQLPDAARQVGRILRAVRIFFGKIKEEMNEFVQVDDKKDKSKESKDSL